MSGTKFVVYTALVMLHTIIYRLKELLLNLIYILEVEPRPHHNTIFLVGQVLDKNPLIYLKIVSVIFIA